MLWDLGGIGSVVTPVTGIVLSGHSGDIPTDQAEQEQDLGFISSSWITGQIFRDNQILW